MSWNRTREGLDGGSALQERSDSMICMAYLGFTFIALGLFCLFLRWLDGEG